MVVVVAGQPGVGKTPIADLVSSSRRMGARQLPLMAAPPAGFAPGRCQWWRAGWRA
ncbi:hypothetical protein [Streptomyces sp. NPDC001978]|uniref:hypothetical protein n=1 Tax=Streptomyces sp. NPDC001978 TaxID=3364627 RepID=UPI003689D0F8